MTPYYLVHMSLHLEWPSSTWDWHLRWLAWGPLHPWYHLFEEIVAYLCHYSWRTWIIILMVDLFFYLLWSVEGYFTIFDIFSLFLWSVEGFSPIFYYREEKTIVLEHCIVYTWYWDHCISSLFWSMVYFIHCIERSKLLYKLDSLHFIFMLGSLETCERFYLGNKGWFVLLVFQWMDALLDRSW